MLVRELTDSNIRHAAKNDLLAGGVGPDSITSRASKSPLPAPSANASAEASWIKFRQFWQATVWPTLDSGERDRAALASCLDHAPNPKSKSKRPVHPD